MRFENWKDAAELLALVAVVGSLIAVVLELRQTQTALQAQTYQERAFDAIARHLDTASNPHLDVLNPARFDRNDTVEMIVMFASIWRDFGLRESRPDFRAEVDRVLAGPATE